MRINIFTLLAIGLIAVPGCSSFQKTPWGDGLAAQEIASPPNSPDAGEGLEIEDKRNAAVALTDYVTGKGPADREKARQLYRDAEALFEQASAAEGKPRMKLFRKSAGVFVKASKEWKDSALEEDALMMAGESYFFADDFPESDKMYGELLERHPRSRHIDRVVARRFEIAKYWLAVDKQGGQILPVNLTNHRLPALDVDGSGIKLLDQIRYDAPTGKLADDATMAAGLEYFERKKWTTADGFFSDLRESFPDSNHQFNAHLFGLKCKLEIYQGPKYSGTVLNEAEDLVSRMQRLFANELEKQENRDMVSKAVAEIDHLQAERLYSRAQFRELRSENGAAKFYYRQLIEEHPKTSYAETARERLAAIEGKPDNPPQRLAWLNKIFPDSEPAKPIMVGSPSNMLR
ncbi:Outer membrane protein assembly factor BamD [Rosistilla carotiformis]|uniref:Outer membrane protein assembly factor BamD n=1 Tax=Rosistilla carotiformis TaxID=2528017 RepID=A0A518JXZ1_9BACT|nr:tetratricopeptide repeat protein [Rosistilla carotiformis]QDV70410.1 Outer membrane protein assembly factor BamD [Rosistilla carotiformis]